MDESIDINQSANSNPLVIIIELERRIRQATTTEEIQFIIVNELHNLVKYRQSILLPLRGNNLVFSGISQPDKTSPFYIWVNENITKLMENTPEATFITQSDIKVEASSEWSSWLPEYGILMPITNATGELMGTLFLARDEEWDDSDIELMKVVTEASGHALNAMVPQKKNNRAILQKLRSYKGIGIILLLLILCLPVRLTVLGPAEIVPIDPATIRAPFDGVIDKIFVKPNQIIKAEEKLFKMDTSAYQNDLEVAEKIWSSLRAEYSQISRLALKDPRSKRRLTNVTSKIREQEIKVSYLKSLIDRMNITSPITGSVILNDPTNWEGRPVNLGEKIMGIADPKAVEIEVWLSVTDTIRLPKESPIKVYLNSDPLNPIEGALYSFSYEAEARAGETYAHRIRGKILEANPLPRLGLRGTARIQGESVSIAYWLARRPLSVIRQFLGL